MSHFKANGIIFFSEITHIIPYVIHFLPHQLPQSSKKESEAIETIVSVYDDFLEWSTTNGKKLGTVKSLRTTRNHLDKFIVTYPVKIDDFTKKVYDA